jgi:hypothetical protein
MALRSACFLLYKNFVLRERMTSNVELLKRTTMAKHAFSGLLTIDPKSHHPPRYVCALLLPKIKPFQYMCVKSEGVL